MDAAKAVVELTVRPSDTTVDARLVFTNGGRALVFLDKINALLNGDEPENDVLKITTDEPQPIVVQYMGKLVKRRRPTLADFLRLEPGRSVEANVRLDRFYAFPAGYHKYVITYSAYHQYPERDGFWQLVSAPVHFAWKR